MTDKALATTTASRAAPAQGAAGDLIMAERIIIAYYLLVPHTPRGPAAGAEARGSALRPVQPPPGHNQDARTARTRPERPAGNADGE